MLADSRVDASGIIAKLLYYAILLITLQIAFGVWGPNPVSDVLTGHRHVAAVRGGRGDHRRGRRGDRAGGARPADAARWAGCPTARCIGTIASVFVWGLGLIAALNQIGVATTVTLPVLITVLATIGGIAVVGVGGGLVRPMQARWDRWLNRAEDGAAAGEGGRGRVPARPRGRGAHGRGAAGPDAGLLAGRSSRWHAGSAHGSQGSPGQPPQGHPPQAWPAAARAACRADPRAAAGAFGPGRRGRPDGAGAARPAPSTVRPGRRLRRARAGRPSSRGGGPGRRFFASEHTASRRTLAQSARSQPSRSAGARSGVPVSRRWSSTPWA